MRREMMTAEKWAEYVCGLPCKRQFEATKEALIAFAAQEAELLVEAVERLADTRKSHYKASYDNGCNDCGETWPCPNVRALDALVVHREKYPRGAHTENPS